MSLLEILVWLSLGGLIALAKVRFGELPMPPAREAVLTVVLCSGAALSGGFLGLWVVRPQPDLGDFNVASMVLSFTAAVVVLLAHSAIHEHRFHTHRS